jgi:cytochrome c oxidase cbb3-type subunit 3
MNDPKEKKDPLLLDHEADGIKELDNDLPRWWVWLFYLCILQAAGYLLYYHVFNLGKLQAAEYAEEFKAGEAIKAGALQKFESSIANLTPDKNKAVLDKGLQTFTTYCSPCHRPDGGGLVGPNLTDDYWIHGSQYSDTLKVIWNGVEDKGMLAWKKQGFKPEDVISVASYIYTMRGTKPPNPKPPENTVQPVKPNEFE